MRAVRLLVRTVACAVTVLVLVPVVVLGLPFAQAVGRLGAWRAHMTRVWSRCLCWVLGAEVEVVGRAPRGSFVLVANHLSYVDVLVLGSCLPCTFVSKSDVGSWPVLGWLSRLAGTIFVDRARRRDVLRVGRQIEAALREGRAVVLFPEGTSSAGDGVLPFRSSLLEPAATLELPVHYASLRYATDPGEVPARLSVAWWGDMEFVPHVVGLLKLPGFRARIVFGEDPVKTSERKSLAARLHAAVASRFLPMLPDEDACLTSRTSPANS